MFKIKIIPIYIALIGTLNLLGQETSQFHHVLIYTWDHHIDEVQKKDFLKIFQGLPEKIEGLEEVSITKILNASEGGHVRIDLTFLSKNILPIYQQHPDHTRIEQNAVNIIRDYQFFQFLE